ncbi:MAG: NmrA family NAD(P)-binding protein [Planctomycetota bacterium]
MYETILVTGATGKTGGHLTLNLLERGLPVRAFTRKRSPESERLREAGAEIAIGDMLDIHSLQAAFEGVRRVYFAYPFTPGLLEAGMNLVACAKEAEVELLVNLSQIITSRGHASAATHQHWLSEQGMGWAGIPTAHLYPGLFMENLLLIAAPSVAAGKDISLPWGAGRHAPVAAADIARVAAAILAAEDPEQHLGQRYVVTGPEVYSMAEVASLIGAAIGRDIGYREITDDEWLQAIGQWPEAYNNPQFRSHAPALAADIREGQFDRATTVVRDVAGAAPTTLPAFLDQVVDHFRDSQEAQHA